MCTHTSIENSLHGLVSCLLIKLNYVTDTNGHWILGDIRKNFWKLVCALQALHMHCQQYAVQQQWVGEVEALYVKFSNA